MASLIQSSKVDWDLVDEELDRVPEEFKDPRFDSLRHVLDILSAVDAEAALEELKTQQETIEQLVDNVVQGYHSGFNKAIHNYSQILHLFSVAKDQVHKVRTQLEDSQRRLASQSGILEIQWKKSVTTDEIVRLLSNIRGFVDMPERISRLQESKDWSGAVVLLLDACTQIAGQEYSGIPALRETRRELTGRRNLLLKAVTAELEKLVYVEVETSNDMATLSSLGSAATAPSISPQGSPKSIGGRLSSRLLRRSPSNPALTASITPRMTPRLVNTRLKKLRELIDSAVQIGGTVELQNALRRHSAEQIRISILRVLTESNISRAVLMQTTDVLRKDFTVDPMTAKAADRIINKVLFACMQVFENLIVILQLIEGSKAPTLTAGLELLLAGRPSEASDGYSSLGGSYTKTEAAAIWILMQKEIQKLLNELLQPHKIQGSLKEYHQGVATQGDNKLSFSFDVQLQGVAARALLKREQSMTKWEGDDLEQLVHAAMFGRQGNAYLVPHIYRTIKMFADEGNALLANLDTEAASGWFGSGEQEANRSLTNFVNSFVESAFIPTIFMDFKKRCSVVLEDDESFRARAKPQAVYAPGASLLPAVTMLKTFVTELLQWATLMPTFSVRLTGILENMLEKVLDAFKARVKTIVADTAVEALLADMSVSNRMGASPSALLAGTPVAFFTERNAESVDNFVASIVKFGFGTGGEIEDINLLLRLMQDRPIRHEDLLGYGDTSRCMGLAAISDSMDFLADLIQGKIGEHSESLIRSSSDSSGTIKRRNTMADLIATPGTKFNPTTLLDGLEHMVDRFRAIAGQSLRALRLNMLLKVIFNLDSLAKSRFVCDPEEVQDLDECVGALQRSASRIDEDIAPFLPARKREYVFEGMAAAAARCIMWMLPDIQEINKAGVAKMSRILAVLQPYLAALGAEGGLFRPEAARHLEKARNYYSHLTYSPAQLISIAQARPNKFSLQEWMFLVEVNYHGRVMEPKHRAELHRIAQAGERRPK